MNRGGSSRGASALIVLRVLAVLFVPVSACSNSVKLSVERAKQHVEELAHTAEADVQEVRGGLPQGATVLAKFWPQEGVPDSDPGVTLKALSRARDGVQDLRLAKSTFFALASTEGVVLRSDAEQDRLAGTTLFKAFPQLQQGGAHYIETQGAMPELSGVRGKPDGQWVAANPVTTKDGIHGIYVTGWAWSAYAHRLEFALRGSVRSGIANAKNSEKEPLLYVFVQAGDQVYGAPASPQVNADAVAGRKLLSLVKPGQTYAEEIEITERAFGLAARRAPALGEQVAIVVLRSET